MFSLLLSSKYIWLYCCILLYLLEIGFPIIDRCSFLSMVYHGMPTLLLVAPYLKLSEWNLLENGTLCQTKVVHAVCIKKLITFNNKLLALTLHYSSFSYLSVNVGLVLLLCRKLSENSWVRYFWYLSFHWCGTVLSGRAVRRLTFGVFFDYSFKAFFIGTFVLLSLSFLHSRAAYWMSPFFVGKDIYGVDFSILGKR